MRLIATGGFAHVDSKGRRFQWTLPPLSPSFRPAECGYDKSNSLVHKMNPEPKPKKPLRWRIIALMVQFAAVAIALNAMLILFGVIPNPAEQRREIDAVTYRILSDGYASGSPAYRAALRDAVKESGAIMLSDRERLMAMWAKAVPAGYTVARSVGTREFERSRLLGLVNTGSNSEVPK